jgi:hypothetical protein
MIPVKVVQQPFVIGSGTQPGSLNKYYLISALLFTNRRFCETTTTASMQGSGSGND